MAVTGLAEAVTELLDNEAFAERVVADADAALAPYELDAAEREAIIADATAMGEASGFRVQQFQAMSIVQQDVAALGPRRGALLAGAISRVTGACGEHGCCSWETAFK